MAILPAALLACIASASAPPFNTSAWLGSGYYAPAAAPDNLGWWSDYALFRPHLLRELPLIRATLGFNTLRVFLHTLAFEADPSAFLANVEDFLAAAAANGLRAGLVLFGSGPQGNASTTSQCVPRKGLSNGCWKASPQRDAETSVVRYQPYVEGLLRAHARDARVAFWELANEPVNSTFWNALRDAAFGWARALSPAAPVISCWLDNADTQVVDVHVYSSDFATTWMQRIYLSPAKGALITEGGARWTEPPTVADPQDFGSPLAALNFLRALRAAGGAPFLPGALLGWEVFSGNSNSRWYWAAKAGAPEPHVPWLGFLWPDGTPISFTEAAALREFAGGAPEFLAFDKWLDPRNISNGNPGLLLAPGSSHAARGAGGRPVALTFAMVEAALWLAPGGAAAVVVRAGVPAARAVATSPGALPVMDGYAVTIDAATRLLRVERVEGGAASPLGAAYNLSSRENGLCVGCYNLLRVEVARAPSGGARVAVWLNVMFSDSGWAGNASDARVAPRAPAPLIAAVDNAPALPAGGVSVAAGEAPLRVDYVAALPLTVQAAAYSWHGGVAVASP